MVTWWWRVRYAFWYWRELQITPRQIWSAAQAAEQDDMAPHEAVEAEMECWSW